MLPETLSSKPLISIALPRLGRVFDQAYFGPRPVLELYDLENDPAELHNLSGRPELASIERELLVALQEKMILDWDFLPLPLAE